MTDSGAVVGCQLRPVRPGQWLAMPDRLLEPGEGVAELLVDVIPAKTSIEFAVRWRNDDDAA